MKGLLIKKMSRNLFCPFSLSSCLNCSQFELRSKPKAPVASAHHRPPPLPNLSPSVSPRRPFLVFGEPRPSTPGAAASDSMSSRVAGSRSSASAKAGNPGARAPKATSQPQGKKRVALGNLTNVVGGKAGAADAV